MKLALLALVLAGCVHAPARPTAWTVEGEGPATEALAMVRAARTVYPRLAAGGVVHFVPIDAYRLCYGPRAPADKMIITGCLMRDGVAVAWPTPFECSDLTCSALAHELAHAGGAQTEDAADAGALLINQTFRKGLP